MAQLQNIQRSKVGNEILVWGKIGSAWLSGYWSTVGNISIGCVHQLLRLAQIALQSRRKVRFIYFLHLAGLIPFHYLVLAGVGLIRSFV